MSGIAEVMHNLGYKVQGSDVADNANVERLRDKGIKVTIGHDAEQSRRRRGRGDLDRDQARQSGSRRRARAPHPGRAPRRDAGRADAAEEQRRGRRHARQDDDDLDDRGAARRRRARPDRDQRRHHQRLRLERAARRRRLDGGRGRRERRQLPPADGRRSRSSPTSIPSISIITALRRGEGRVPRIRRERAVLWLRGAVHRSSRSAGAGRPHRDRRVITYGFNPQADVRADRCSRRRRQLAFDACSSATARATRSTPIKASHAADAGPAQCARTRSRRSRWRSSWACPTRRSARACEVRRGQAALHPGRRVERRAIIDDYGHHPVEIRAVLRAAREVAKGRVIAVVQPHRYTRLRACSRSSRPASTMPTR